MFHWSFFIAFLTIHFLPNLVKFLIMKIVNEYEKGTPFSFLGLHMAQNLDKLKS